MARLDGNAAKRVADTSPGPWKTDARWRRLRSRHSRAIRFIETYCKPPKGSGHGELLRLARFQKEFLEAVLAPGVDVGVMATPRGNGKSSLGGALAVWALFDDDDTGAPQVPVIATTITQAIRSCYGVAVSMIKSEPALLNRAIPYTGIASTRVVVPFNEGEMFPIANDPDGLQGLDPSLGIVDEIGFQPVEAWDSLRMGAGKRPHSTIVGLGTPGFDHDNALYQLRQTDLAGGLGPTVVFKEYAAPATCAVDDRSAWRVANPALERRDRTGRVVSGFLRESALETDLAITDDAHFRIFRLGQWVEGTDAWLGPDGRSVWEALTSPWDLVDGAPTWVGIDIGLKRDSTAVVVLQRRPDTRWHAVCRLWVPTEDEPVDVTDVMQYLRQLDERYAVEAFSYDPRLFDVPAKFLEDEGLAMVEVPQALERMTQCVGDLYSVIRAGQLTHDGDPAFAAQVLAAVPRYNGVGYTLAKGKSRGRIDACIALALALDRAQRTAAEPEVEPLVAWA